MINQLQTRALLAACVAVVMMIAGQGAAGVLAAQDSPGFKEFSDRVQEYVKLHKAAGEGSEAQKQTKNPQQIDDRKQDQVKKIRGLRPDAKRGDIFTPAATQAFTQAIKGAFSSATASTAKQTIRSGEPLKGFQVQVNQMYPPNLPFTTVPPTLLLVLPRLPDQVAYRILGDDLLLVDVTVNIIVDYIPDVIPQATG